MNVPRNPVSARNRGFEMVLKEHTMEATNILMDEHKVIERVIAALETAASRLGSGPTVRPGFFIDASEFIKGFADGCHHKKEEGVLFPAMEAAGVPRDGGPIGAMLSDHEAGRLFNRNMRAAAERLAAGDQSAGAEIERNALGYARLLRQHIMKENMVLFPMADRVIPVGKQSEVAEAFEHIEHEETGAGVHEKYLALAEALERELSK
jgi:hemerythrin-like domain-containing protein